MCEMANTVFGLLGDAMPEADYKKISMDSEALEEYLLRQAEQFDSVNLVDAYEGKNIFSERLRTEQVMPIMDDFEEFVLHDKLPNILAWRDFNREHSEEEQRKMAKKNGGYFGAEIYPYEKRYWDEFEKYGFERLEVVAIGSKAHRENRTKKNA